MRDSRKYLKYAGWAVGVSAAVGIASAASRRQARRKELAGQVVVITGGSRGLGLALGRALGALQCRIAICARQAGELERAGHILRGEGYEVFTIGCDVSDRDSVAKMIDGVIGHYGQIDILVNNAGEILVAPLENLEAADFERAMGVMFWGMLYTTLAVLPSMKSRGKGRIVNIASIGGKVSVPHLLSYSCAKAAAAAFSNGLGNEVRQFGVEVTTIIPGLMRTGSHVNARFKGNRVRESAWFGVAASMPGLSISAERAARNIVDAMCAQRAEKVIGLPAQLLVEMQALFPNAAAEMLHITNRLLPKGNAEGTAEPGRDLEDQHGAVYEFLTNLGKRAGRRLNQPVQVT